MLSLILQIASTAGNETNIADELISLTVKDEPLGDVFKKVSMARNIIIVIGADPNL